jgi:hypothetical protein
MAPSQESLHTTTQLTLDRIRQVVKAELQRYGLNDEDVQSRKTTLEYSAVGTSRDKKHWRVLIQATDNGADRAVDVMASGDSGGRKTLKFLRTYVNSGSEGFWDMATGHAAQSSGMVSLSSSVAVAKAVIDAIDGN